MGTLSEHVVLLKRRSYILLNTARRLIEERSYDVACFLLEQALQLRLKATLLRVFAEEHRGHCLRELFSRLSLRLSQIGFQNLSERINYFVDENRHWLIVLEEAYSEARYSARVFQEHEAKNSLNVVENAFKLLDEVEENVLGKGS